MIRIARMNKFVKYWLDTCKTNIGHGRNLLDTYLHLLDTNYTC